MPDSRIVIASSQGNTIQLKPGVNLRIGEQDLESDFDPLTTLERDLLILASSIYSSDLAFRRGEREIFTRSINVTIPVTNRALFNSIRDDIRSSLYRLSDDAWNLDFVQHEGIPEAYQKWSDSSGEKVLLFSGGLDSYAAALELGYAKTRVRLVSHVTGNRISANAQQQLFQILDNKFPSLFRRNAVRVGAVSKPGDGYPFPSDAQRENTQRTRSFLFLALAGIVARRIGSKDVIMIAENGQMAIHLPLTAARISAFSTHTAHPEFVSIMSKILETLLSYQVNIYNPYLYMTKAEIVKRALGADSNTIASTVSCWQSARPGPRSHSHSHCGECIPCLIRRIANEANGIKLEEYNRDLLSEEISSLDESDKGRRNFIELAEFVKFFEQAKSEAEILMQYPELLNPYIDSQKAIDLHFRFAKQARAVFNNYKNLSSLVS